MKYVRGRDSKPVRSGGETTSGDVVLDRIIDEEVSVTSAVFQPRARTHWHTHEFGQVIIVDAGMGMIATKKVGSQIVTAGDAVFTPPDEEHWHGAAPDSFIVYKAVTLGTTHFTGEVTEREYDAVPWQLHISRTRAEN